jgi:preprotein translocase subunit SecF
MAWFPVQFIRPGTTFDFMGKRWYGFIVSISLTVLALGLLFTKGLNLGIDFTGGVLLEIRTEQPADLSAIRNALGGQGFGEYSLQNFGDPRDVMIRIQLQDGVDQAQVVSKVKERVASVVSGTIDYRNIEFVGPAVGRELIRGGIIATLLSFVGIMAYLWFRFEWQYGVGGILALLHDTIMMIGFFAFMRLDFGLTALAAILTVIGYSINDSVVIYDRIRENMRKYKKMSMSDLLNLSINETLSRTIMTAGTTLLASLALAVFGGEVIKSFSWAMVFGVIVGTYSSIYISAPTLIYLALRAEKKQEAAA